MEAAPRAQAAQATEEEGGDEDGDRLAAQAEAHAADVAFDPTEETCLLPQVRLVADLGRPPWTR